MKNMISKLSCAAILGLLGVSLSSAVQAQGSSENWELTTVADDVYSFRFFVHRNMVVVTNDGVIVTDPMGATAAAKMIEAIGEVTDQPVKYVIYSHDHWDHISGAQVFKDNGATIIQHELAAATAGENESVVPADTTWSGAQHDIELGDQTVELHYIGPSHGEGMTVMRLPEQGILHTIDVVTPERIAFSVMPGSTPSKWIEALTHVESLEFERIIPGHGPAEAPREAVMLQREYLEDLSSAITEAAGVVGNPFAFDKITELVKADLRPKYGDWEQFDAWMSQNVMRITFEQRMGW